MKIPRPKISIIGNPISSIICLLFLSYLVFIQLDDSVEYMTLNYFGRLLLNPPKTVDLHGTKLYLPRGSFVDNIKESDNLISGIIHFRYKYKYINTLIFFKNKKLSTDLMRNFFLDDAENFVYGDILPLIYVYQVDGESVYMAHRFEWDLKSLKGLPIVTNVVIPDRNFDLIFSLRNENTHDILNLIKKFVYNDQNIEFKLDNIKTNQLNP